jgi:hypothetical protein
LAPARPIKAAMSPLDALRFRREPVGLPPAATDDELLAWSETLVRRRPATHPRRTTPLRAERRAPGAADRLGSLSLEELFDEIRHRHRPTRHV